MSLPTGRIFQWTRGLRVPMIRLYLKPYIFYTTKPVSLLRHKNISTFWFNSTAMESKSLKWLLATALGMGTLWTLIRHTGLLVSQARSKKELDVNTPNCKSSNDFIAETAKKVLPCVVEVRTDSRFGTNSRFGSGVVVVNGQHVITNAHVVGDTQTVKIVGSKFVVNGEVTECDDRMDLALIRMDHPSSIQPAQLAEVDSISPGQWVVALGSPYNLTNTVTHGIVSAVRKGNGIDFIQTDAVACPGSSGGPLVNLDGKVIGINTLAFPSGFTFAVSVSEVQTFLIIANKEGKAKTFWSFIYVLVAMFYQLFSFHVLFILPSLTFFNFN